MSNTRLSVNINKVATIRNARGGNMPDLIQFARDCERFGAQGITVHPRPDGRHIKYQDVRDLKPIVTTEFNIEGYPSDSFMDLVLEVVPTQVTLVPDPPEALTSNAGWDTIQHRAFLTSIIERLHAKGIRASIFVNADAEMVAGAKATGTDRVELYTESYAANYLKDREAAIHDFIIDDHSIRDSIVQQFRSFVSVYWSHRNSCCCRIGCGSKQGSDAQHTDADFPTETEEHSIGSARELMPANGVCLDFNCLL